MVAAVQLIEAVRSHLTANLTVPSVQVGVGEPTLLSDLPNVVISLHQLVNPSKGLGAHRQVQQGALAAHSAIDLADPVLDGVPLLSEDRLVLNLLHGGLVDAQGSDTPLQAGDIQVARNATPFTLVAGVPAAGEFSVDAPSGQLTFGTALPADGLMQADYYIGQWERLTYQLQGILRVACVAEDNTDAEVLSNQVYNTLAAHQITGLRELEITDLGAVAGFSESASMRARNLEWRFDYEAILDIPESSGGIIRQVTLHSSQDGMGVEEEQIE